MGLYHNSTGLNDWQLLGFLCAVASKDMYVLIDICAYAE